MFKDFRRILKPHHLLYAQERGMPTTRDELLHLFKDIGDWDAGFYENYIDILIKSVDSFLINYGNISSENPLRKDVIMEIVFLYIKNYPTFREYETQLKKKDQFNIGLAHYPRDNSSHIDASNHYIQELYCYLVHGPHINLESIANATPKVSPRVARDIIAEWFVPLEPTQHKDRIGIEEPLFSEKIQRASKRWNIYQAPNKRRGVYLSKIEIIDGKRTFKVLYDEQSIQKYRPNYSLKKQ